MGLELDINTEIIVYSLSSDRYDYSLISITIIIIILRIILVNIIITQ